MVPPQRFAPLITTVFVVAGVIVHELPEPLNVQLKMIVNIFALKLYELPEPVIHTITEPSTGTPVSPVVASVAFSVPVRALPTVPPDTVHSVQEYGPVPPVSFA